MGLSIRFLIGLGEPSTPRPVNEELEARMAPEGYRYGQLGKHNSDPIRQRERRARTVLGDAYECGSFFMGKGVWKGQREPSLMFETVLDVRTSEITRRQDAEDRARDIAKRLSNVLGQDAIGLVFTPVDFELVSVA